jgi:hypothetical protein
VSEPGQFLQMLFVNPLIDVLGGGRHQNHCVDGSAVVNQLSGNLPGLLMFGLRRAQTVLQSPRKRAVYPPSVPSWRRSAHQSRRFLMVASCPYRLGS